jgi:hypothetical protein
MSRLRLIALNLNNEFQHPWDRHRNLETKFQCNLSHKNYATHTPLCAIYSSARLFTLRMKVPLHVKQASKQAKLQVLTRILSARAIGPSSTKKHREEEDG